MMLKKRASAGLKNFEVSLSLLKSLNSDKKVQLIKVDSRKLDLPALLTKGDHEYKIISKGSISSEVFYKRKKVNRILANWNETEIIMESIFTKDLSPYTFEAEVGVVRSKNFSNKKKQYQRLIIPVKKKVSFFSIIEDRTFETSTLHSRECVRANFKSYSIDIFPFKDKEKNNFLIIDCDH